MFIYSYAYREREREQRVNATDREAIVRRTRCTTANRRCENIASFPISFRFCTPLFTFFFSKPLGAELVRLFFFYSYYVFMRQRLSHLYANKNGIILRNSYIIYLIGREGVPECILQRSLDVAISQDARSINPALPFDKCTLYWNRSTVRAYGNDSECN